MTALLKFELTGELHDTTFPSLESEALVSLVVATLDANKGSDIRVIDVRGKTSITDFMVVVSGTSERHVRALAEYVAAAAKEKGVRPVGMEGERVGEWVLLDLGDVVMHSMKPQIRQFYQLEKLWMPG